MLIRQAIVTKFLPCTNFRESRVKATAQAGSVTLSWDHGLNSDENHAAAAQALAQKYKWDGAYYAGGIPGHSGYAFVCVDTRYDRDSNPVFTIDTAPTEPREKNYRILPDGSFIRDVG
jgi:hypothetical protein